MAEMSIHRAERGFSIYFDIGAVHKQSLLDYFSKMDEQKIEYNIFEEPQNTNPMMCSDGECVYSLDQIKKRLEKILENRA